MDSFNRSTQPQNVAPSAPSPVSNNVPRKSNNVKDTNKLARIAAVVLAALVAIVLVVLTVYIVFGGKSQEQTFVDDSKYQAVFLNTGQVYFGKVDELNNKYFKVSQIYYLQTSSTGTDAAAAANTSVSLVKLGCELHAPTDQMVINRDQVTFWENLKDDGQVAQAIKTFTEQNPDGQNCSDTAANSSPTNVQGSTNTQGTTNTGATTPATGTTNP